MKKFAYTILLGASALVAACTALPREEQVTLQGNPDEVAFSAYLNRGVTKAGAVGELKTDGLQTAGFGVFGYHTDNALYSQAALPNFMYNTKVSTASWTYSPIKYWPNEYGENASSEAIDRLTFFAYAPWVEINSSTGALKVTEDPGDASTSHSTGITRLSRATDTGDPLVSYVVSFNPASSVDLTWGVAKTAFTNSAGTSEGTNSIAANTPYINVARPSAGTTIDFSFQHALAALNVTVDANVAGEALNADQTRIYVRSVTFEGFAGEGSLNLNSTVAAGPQWVNYFANGALSTESVTIYDGLRDGREATSADANEKPANLNENIIQSTTYAAGAKAGVTATAVNLFNSATSTAPVYVIPTGDNLKVTIAYDVETQDPKILGTYLADGATHGAVVENTITKTITGIGAMEAGKKYVVALHLGLNSVDFDADITAWEDAGINESDLPFNSFAVTFTQGGTPVTAPMNLWMGGSSATREATADTGSSGYSIPGGFVYSSSNEAVATVNATSGEVTAVAPGEATITATGVATKASSATIAGSYKVIVNSVFVSSEKAIVYKGGTDVTLSVTPVPDATYAWNVSDGTSYLSIEGADDAATVTLKGLNAGTAKVTCSINSVASPDPITIAVAPDAYTVGGKFSGPGSSYFYFAKGNLYALASDWEDIGGGAVKPNSVEWYLFENQYDYRKDVTKTNNSVWDHFGWNGASGSIQYGLSNQVAAASYGTVIDETISEDWGVSAGKSTNLGGNGTENSLDWKTMTSDEMLSIFASKSRVTVVIISGEDRNGLIVKPSDGNIDLADSYTEEAWKMAELAGYAFLPAAGYRSGMSMVSYEGYGSGQGGYYWTQTASTLGSGGYACCFFFGLQNKNVNTSFSTNRYKGCSVRLIRKIN